MDVRDLSKVPVWLDCDTGHDDAFAILLAAYHPRSRLVGVSTVYGNAPIHHTTPNTCAMLKAIGRSDVPVVRGEAKPLSRAARFAPEYHGADGLGGVTLLPAPALEQMENLPAGVEEIYRRLMVEEEDSVWIVPTGPLTNIAKLILEKPDVLSRIRGISIMGGAVGGGFSDAPLHGKENFGNCSNGVAEFNIFCDPEAAHYVFSNLNLADKLTLATLDLTHHCRANESVLDRLSGPSKLKRLMREILEFFKKSYETHSRIADGPPIHDPVAVLAALEPELFEDGKGERWKVDVILDGEELGRTVLTTPKEGELPFRHRVPRNVDVEAFWARIETCLDQADKTDSLN